MSYKPIGPNLKTASVAVLKSTENDVTLTSFVTDLSYPGLSNFYIMCEIDASLALIFAFVWEISQENERGAPKRRILLSATVPTNDLARISVKKRKAEQNHACSDVRSEDYHTDLHTCTY